MARNETAVSESYEGVHLTDAVRRSKDGDSKLEDLLHWAIQNSDQDQLKQQAASVAADSVTLNDRQKSIQQVL